MYQDTVWVHLKFSFWPHTQDQEKENREKLFHNLFLRFCLLHSYCLQNKKLSDSGPKTLSLSDMRLWRTSFRIVQSTASELQLEIWLHEQTWYSDRQYISLSKGHLIIIIKDIIFIFASLDVIWEKCTLMYRKNWLIGYFRFSANENQTCNWVDQWHHASSTDKRQGMVIHWKLPGLLQQQLKKAHSKTERIITAIILCLQCEPKLRKYTPHMCAKIDTDIGETKVPVVINFTHLITPPLIMLQIALI